MGTEAIKVVTSTSDKGVKTTTFTKTEEDKTSVFTLIDHNKDGKYDGFKLSGKFTSNEIKECLDAQGYKASTSNSSLIDENGESLILPDAESSIKEGKEYNLPSFVKRLSAKSTDASSTTTTATTDKQQQPGYTVDNNALQNVIGMYSSMLGGMFMQGINSTGSLFQYQMPGFVASLWDSLGSAFKVNPYTPPPANNSDGSDGTDGAAGSDGTDGADGAAGSNSSYIHTDKTDEETRLEQEKLEKEEEDKLKAAQDKLDAEEKAKKEKEEADKKAAKEKAEKVSNICAGLNEALKGFGTINEGPRSLDTFVNMIKSDNVYEVMKEWNDLYSPGMDNESLIQSIHNDNYFGTQQKYTSKIAKALAERAKDEDLNRDGKAFESNVNQENNRSWMLLGTRDSIVEDEFNKMFTKIDNKIKLKGSATTTKEGATEEDNKTKKYHGASGEW